MAYSIHRFNFVDVYVSEFAYVFNLYVYFRISLRLVYAFVFVIVSVFDLVVYAFVFVFECVHVHAFDSYTPSHEDSFGIGSKTSLLRYVARIW